MIVPNPNSEDHPSVFSIKTDQTLSVNKAFYNKTAIDPSSTRKFYRSIRYFLNNVGNMNIFSSTQEIIQLQIYLVLIAI